MTNELPINLEKSPRVILEVITRLKIKDAMTTKVITANKNDSLRALQIAMKNNNLSGIPIVEKTRIIGLISIDDIITALDKGYIEDKVEPYMSKKLVMLEDDMPLSFAINYFQKYRYGRFPVINKHQNLVGIITSRDILTVLLNELDKEIKRLENSIRQEAPDIKKIESDYYTEYPIGKYDLENAGTASFKIKKVLKERNFSNSIIRRISVAAYELEINIAIHSDGGKLIFTMNREEITIIAKDTGPGIKDTSLVEKKGYSTANEWIRSLGFGAGMGIPNTKRVSDNFCIESELDVGTTVTASFNINETGDKK